MFDAVIPYIPLFLLTAFLALCGVLIWRSGYNLGALIIQLGTAAFLSSLVGFTLWVIGIVMIINSFFPEIIFAWRVNLILGMSIGSTTGYAMVKRHGTASESVSISEIAISFSLAAVGAIIGFILFLDVQFGADFVPNASDASGAYFGALIGGNLPLAVVGIKRVYRNLEP